MTRPSRPAASMTEGFALPTCTTGLLYRSSALVWGAFALVTGLVLLQPPSSFTYDAQSAFATHRTAEGSENALKFGDATRGISGAAGSINAVQRACERGGVQAFELSVRPTNWMTSSSNSQEEVRLSIAATAATSCAFRTKPPLASDRLPHLEVRRSISSFRQANLSRFTSAHDFSRSRRHSSEGKRRLGSPG